MTLDSFLILFFTNTIIVLTMIAIIEYDRIQRRKKEEKKDSDIKCPWLFITIGYITNTTQKQGRKHETYH